MNISCSFIGDAENGVDNKTDIDQSPNAEAESRRKGVVDHLFSSGNFRRALQGSFAGIDPVKSENADQCNDGC